ncbi:MAG: hypothetical protein K8I03_04940 [Ignavibacteria bacterium]|nr:hypothetical protein [Ignavibacteria bacterium]
MLIHVFNISANSNLQTVSMTNQDSENKKDLGSRLKDYWHGDSLTNEKKVELWQKFSYLPIAIVAIGLVIMLILNSIYE